jgi:hypothetical protein
MKYANVSVNRNGPTSCDTLCTLEVAPCNWPCWSGATSRVISDWTAAPETPHNAITGIPSQDNGPVGARPKITKPTAPQPSPSISARRSPK